MTREKSVDRYTDGATGSQTGKTAGVVAHGTAIQPEHNSSHLIITETIVSSQVSQCAQCVWLNWDNLLKVSIRIT